MKTKFKHILLTLALGLVSLTSCDSYLDMTEVERQTFDKIWEKAVQSDAYLATVYGYLPRHYNPNSEAETGNMELAFFGATDESSMSWPNWKGAGGRITDGGWNPGAVPNARWAAYYRGIREATIYMNNIDRVPFSEFSSNEQEGEAIKAGKKTEARFLRAFYYFSLMRQYGPVILIDGSTVLDPTASQAELSHSRNSWDECVAFVTDEINACIADGVIGSLPETVNDINLGRPTKGVALAVLSRMTLYSARPLFNGNTLYAGVKNKIDGKQLFPQTEDREKWKIAADAAKAVIDLNEYRLVRVGGDPFESYAAVFEQRFNEEIIWGRNGSSSIMATHITPRKAVDGYTSYGGWGPTQQQVDAYAMSSGKYPITGYTASGSPIIDPTANYVDNEWVSYENPFDKNGAAINYSMYKDREPRFYVSVFWNNQKWYQTGGGVVTFHTGGTSGPPEQDHARTGYLNRKFAPRENLPKSLQFMTFSWPYFRYAEILLNYAEALNEYYGPSNPEIKVALNDVRNRAGVPNLETIYPEAFASKESLRAYILKERRIELAFEGHRYFDTRTWMMNVDGGPMYGMNIAATSSSQSGGFWNRVVIEERVFKPSYYLYPMQQTELNKNFNLTQNYGW